MSAPPWIAQMISPLEDFSGAPLLRKRFTLEAGHGKIVQATLRATALGIFEATINGLTVGPDVLSPGWSAYEWRLQYRTYDVKHLLHESDAVLGVSLGNGWYRGRLGWEGGRAFYGPDLGFFGQLDIQYSDGHLQTVATDTSWMAGPSATISNDLYDGQTIDARLYDASWATPGHDTSKWGATRVLPFDISRLADPVGPPVVRQEVIKPIDITTSPSGKTLVDFGQNMVGWLRFNVIGERGRTITVRHAEVLEAGELGDRPLRTAKATDTFILSGNEDQFEPTMTFHGFRYAEIDGWPGPLTTDSIEAVVVHSDLRRTGHFECSNDMLNQLHRNVVWGLKGNFVDVPTDCPQRDERLGWTGDIAVFAPTAAYLYDVKGFLQDWLADLAAEQAASDGLVPFTIPDMLKYQGHPPFFPPLETTAIWSDAAVWVPMALYEAYGDETVLRHQFDSMVSHSRRIESLLSPAGLWDKGFQFADWLDPDANPDEPWNAKADTSVVATACAYRTAKMTAQAASILGEHQEAAHFWDLADRLQKSFNTHYVNATGLIQSDCPTVYALAIAFELLPENCRAMAGDRLAELVCENGYKVATGFAGTPFILQALSDTGHVETAYRLLLEEGCPSWLYPVTMGATTVWERWDSMLPDGTINPGEMTSFNHYALGSVADWMHKCIGGITALAPGYRRVLIAPRPGGGVTSASTSIQTQHGLLEVAWVLNAGAIQVDMTIPKGITAKVSLPGDIQARFESGRHKFTAESSLISADGGVRTS